MSLLYYLVITKGVTQVCKIITVLNKNSRNKKLIQKFIDLQEEELQAEQNGYSVYSQKERHTRFYMGQKAYKNIKNNLQYDNSNIYMIHFRTSTGGELTKDGLHLQNFDDKIWCHNGTCSSIRHTDKSDSYYFFDSLLDDEISVENIEKNIEESGFWGRAFVYDKNLQKLYVFMTACVYITALASDCIIITSYQPNLSETETITSYGLDFERDNQVIVPWGSKTLNNCLVTFDHGRIIGCKQIKPKEKRPQIGFYDYQKRSAYNEIDYKNHVYSYDRY